jgi:hypothetical protein
MYKNELREKYPNIAFTFENILYATENAKKYKFLIYNYGKSTRGLSLERIFEILVENQFICRIDKRKWFEEG